MEVIWRKNPDTITLPSSINHLFNKHSYFDGNSLIYYACREGKIHIVKFLLEKGIPFVLKRINFSLTKAESCLEVACRLNYTKLLLLILKSKEYSTLQIDKVLSSSMKLSKEVIRLLEKYCSVSNCFYRYMKLLC